MNNDFTTTIEADQSPQQAFDAINRVADWWQGEVEGSTHKLDDEFIYRMKEFHYSKQKIVESIPCKKVVWLVTDSKLTFNKNPHEWNGTRIVFDIAEVNGKTQVRFTHQGLHPAFECYGACSNAWSRFVGESLYSLITTGKGKNVF